MSRRLLLAAPIAVGLVLLGARASRGDGQCLMEGAEDAAQSTMSGDVSVDRGDGPSAAVGSPFGFTLGSSESNGWSPVGRGDAVDFSFALVDGISDRPTIGIQCRRASLAAIASGSALPLKTLCGAAASDAEASGGSGGDPDGSLRVHAFVGSPMREVWLVFDLAEVEGTARGASSLNRSGDGTVEVTLDVPMATLTTAAIVDVNDLLVIPDAPPVTISFSASHLKGATAFAPRSTACPPDGGCDCGGIYHGWLPGGG